MAITKKLKQSIEFFYIDTMRDFVWPFYHKWILHRGKDGMMEWLTCRHNNPFFILTPRLFKKQIEGVKDVEI